MNAIAKCLSDRDATVAPCVAGVASCAANSNESPDFVTVFRPWNPYTGRHSTEHPGKRLTLLADGTIHPQNFPNIKFFTGSTVAVRNIQDLSAALAITAAERTGFIVRGALADARTGAVFSRRKSDRRDGVAVGAAPARHFWLPLDFDDIPNMLELDPRRRPDATLDWILTLLPPALSRVSVAWDWSSSMCVGLADDAQPATLNLHAWAWLDTALDESETRDLLKSLSRHVGDRLAQAGASLPATKKYVDPKLADNQQPIFVAPPLLIDLSDPFPGAARRGLRQGTSDVVSLAALNAELETCSKKRQKPVRAAAAPKTPRAPRARAAAPPVLAAIIPFDAMTRVLSAKARVEAARGKGNYRRMCELLFAPRAVTEIVSLVRSRVARGEHEPEWREWFDQGGIPEGERDSCMVIVCSLLARSLPREVCTPADVRAATVSIARLIVAEDWLQREWLANGFDGSVLNRVGRALAGEQVVFAGRLTDPRYQYSAARIIREFGISEDEMKTLGLKSLSTDTARSSLRRRQQGAKPRTEITAETKANVRTARQMSEDGMSLRDIGKALGRSHSGVRAMLSGRGKTNTGKRPPGWQKPIFVETSPPGTKGSKLSKKGSLKKGSTPNVLDSKRANSLEIPQDDPCPASLPRAGFRGLGRQIVDEEPYRVALTGAARKKEDARLKRVAAKARTVARTAWHAANWQIDIIGAEKRYQERVAPLKADIKAMQAGGESYGSLKVMGCRSRIDAEWRAHRRSDPRVPVQPPKPARSRTPAKPAATTPYEIRTGKPAQTSLAWGSVPFEVRNEWQEKLDRVTARERQAEVEKASRKAMQPSRDAFFKEAAAGYSGWINAERSEAAYYQAMAAQNWARLHPERSLQPPEPQPPEPKPIRQSSKEDLASWSDWADNEACMAVTVASNESPTASDSLVGAEAETVDHEPDPALSYLYESKTRVGDGSLVGDDSRGVGVSPSGARTPVPPVEPMRDVMADLDSFGMLDGCDLSEAEIEQLRAEKEAWRARLIEAGVIDANAPRCLAAPERAARTAEQRLPPIAACKTRTDVVEDAVEGKPIRWNTEAVRMPSMERARGVTAVGVERDRAGSMPKAAGQTRAVPGFVILGGSAANLIGNGSPVLSVRNDPSIVDRKPDLAPSSFYKSKTRVGDDSPVGDDFRGVDAASAEARTPVGVGPQPRPMPWFLKRGGKPPAPYALPLTGIKRRLNDSERVAEYRRIITSQAGRRDVA